MCSGAYIQKGHDNILSFNGHDNILSFNGHDNILSFNGHDNILYHLFQRWNLSLECS